MREEAQNRKEDLIERTTCFGVRVVKAFVRLPKSAEARVLGRQMLRSGTSVGAQYREAKRARSDAEFTSKLSSAHQELEEVIYWFELLVRCGIVSRNKIDPLLGEADELSAIFSSIIKKMKDRT